MSDRDDFLRRLSRGLKGEIVRSRDSLVPPAFADLWKPARYSVWFGGRGSGKSWSIARALLIMASEKPLRILCCREVQASIRESAYRLLADQIGMLELDDAFEIGADSITGRNGSRFYFEGLRYNASKIRSYEGIDVVWCEEAQSISDISWETLLPTVRQRGSRFFISFNPMTRDDPVTKRFVDSHRPDVFAKRVSWRDNPHLSAEAHAEREWLEKTDHDSYMHVWEGEPREFSDALILKNKVEVAEFEVNPAWGDAYHGCDFGFAADPTAAVRCFIDDGTRTLFVDREYWALGTEIDALPAALEDAVPGISRAVVYCDSARPETISFLNRHGVAGARSVEKWPNSVIDGLAFLRAFAKIVVHPRCRHLIDEAGRYSFKVDRLTSVALPEPVDRHNHVIDSLRYAMSPLIRNKPSGGYFERAALLVRGEPVEPPVGRGERPRRIFATLVAGEQSGAIGLVSFAYNPALVPPLKVLGYSIVEVGEVMNGSWLIRQFERLQEFAHEWQAIEPGTVIWVHGDRLFRALSAEYESAIVARIPLLDLARIEPHLLVSPSGQSLGLLDDQAAELREDVNSGTFCKFARSAYAQQSVHRGTAAAHLVNQILGYRPGAPGDRELAGAFVLGCLMARDPSRRAAVRVGLPAETPIASPMPPPAAEAPVRALPTIMLSPGLHWIDGERVEVLPDGDRDLVEVPLEPGRHYVDGRITIVARPLRIQLG